LWSPILILSIEFQKVYNILMNKPSHQASSKRDFLIILLLVIIILVPRLIGLDKFVTVDEPSWVGYGANFYYALEQREFNKIQSNYTPGVTTMVFGAASVHLYFPEYRRLDQGYFWKDDLGVSNFMLEHGQQPIEILVAGRMFTILGITAALIFVFIYSRRLLGVLPALASVLLISLEPYYLGHSRLFTHEGLISPLLILSILSFLTYLYKERRKTDLFISASAGSIACLTKSTSTIIIPFMVLMSIMVCYERIKNEHNGEEKEARFQFRHVLLPLLIWLGIFIAVYVALWPSMWVAPLETLARVYGEAFKHALGKVITEGEAAGKPISSFLSSQGFRDYFQVMLSRTTPIVWLGFWIGLGNKLFNKKTLAADVSKRTVFYVVVFGGLFYCMMSLGANTFSPHYIMTPLVCLMYVAGIGLAVVIQWIKRFPVFRKVGVPVFLGALIWFQAFSVVSYYPYYYPYTNPIVAAINQGIFSPDPQGYGEGLDLAAEYLSQKPDAKNLTVMSWYSGIPAYLFPGSTEHIKPHPEWAMSSIRKLLRSDYLVIYYDFQLRRNQPEKLMLDIANVTPEHSISMFGTEYIRIYKVSELPESVFIPDSQ
jgi:hypothetical protein